MYILTATNMQNISVKTQLNNKALDKTYDGLMFVNFLIIDLYIRYEKETAH